MCCLLSFQSLAPTVVQIPGTTPPFLFLCFLLAGTRMKGVNLAECAACRVSHVVLVFRGVAALGGPASPAHTPPTRCTHLTARTRPATLLPLFSYYSATQPRSRPRRKLGRWSTRPTCRWRPGARAKCHVGRGEGAEEEEGKHDIFIDPYPVMSLQ